MPAPVDALALTGASVSVLTALAVNCAFLRYMVKRHGSPCPDRPGWTGSSPSPTPRQLSPVGKHGLGDAASNHGSATGSRIFTSGSAVDLGNSGIGNVQGNDQAWGSQKFGSHGHETKGGSRHPRGGVELPTALAGGSAGRLAKRKDCVNRAGVSTVLVAMACTVYSASWVLMVFAGPSVTAEVLLWHDAVLRGAAAPGFFWAAGVILATWMDILRKSRSSDSVMPCGVALLSMFVPCYIAMVVAIAVVIDAQSKAETTGDPVDVAALRVAVEKCLIAGRMAPGMVAFVLPLWKGFPTAKALLTSQVPATRRAGSQTRRMSAFFVFAAVCCVPTYVLLVATDWLAVPEVYTAWIALEMVVFNMFGLLIASTAVRWGKPPVGASVGSFSDRSVRSALSFSRGSALPSPSRPMQATSVAVQPAPSEQRPA